MFSNRELIQSTEYWLEMIQNEIFRQVKKYMLENNLNQSQLAKELNVSKSYISQILNGNFNFTLKKLIELSLAIGVSPDIQFKAIAKLIEEKAPGEKTKTLYKMEKKKDNSFSKSIASEPSEIYQVK